MQVLFTMSKNFLSVAEGCTADFRKDTEPVHKKIPFEIGFEKG